MTLQPHMGWFWEIFNFIVVVVCIHVCTNARRGDIETFANDYHNYNYHDYHNNCLGLLAFISLAQMKQHIKMVQNNSINSN